MWWGRRLWRGMIRRHDARSRIFECDLSAFLFMRPSNWFRRWHSGSGWWCSDALRWTRYGAWSALRCSSRYLVQIKAFHISVVKDTDLDGRLQANIRDGQDYETTSSRTLFGIDADIRLKLSPCCATSSMKTSMKKSVNMQGFSD